MSWAASRPSASAEPCPTVVDVSATGFDRVYVSGGRRGLDISLSPDDLVSATRAVLAPIAR